MLIYPPMNKQSEIAVVVNREYSFCCCECGQRSLLHRVAHARCEQVEKIVRKLDILGESVESGIIVSGRWQEVAGQRGSRLVFPQFVCEHCRAGWYSVDEMFSKSCLHAVMEKQEMVKVALAAHREALRLADNGLVNGYFKRDEQAQFREFYHEMFWGNLNAQGFGMVDIWNMHNMALQAEREEAAKAKRPAAA